MIFNQIWQGFRIHDGVYSEPFPASVPGNIQKDYALSHDFGDVHYGDNCEKFRPLENDFWEYRTTLQYSSKDGERVFFVSHGIDYKYDVFLNGDCLLSEEGMFHKIELDLTDKLLSENNVLAIKIYPHPKRKGSPVGTRDEADHSCKPPVSYGWDWNPRLLISGLWQEAYIETRTDTYINNCEVFYNLSDDFSSADVSVKVDCSTPCTFELFDADGNCVYSGQELSFTVDDPKLWWCNGQGEAYLYTYKVSNAEYSLFGTVGFRRIRMLRNIGAKDPRMFPKSRYDAPFSLELNGRRVFMKGSNWVNPDIFWGDITRERYDEVLTLVRDANMNILRMWGGAGPAKRDFYELCDKYGIMVWQEFMLACNLYPNDDKYLTTLESEARAIITDLRRYPCIVLWCGGNELFNGWSGMDDQSLPLRLLDKLCYELDRARPYIKTSPLIGMGHGCYVFADNRVMGGDVFYTFQHANCVAYTEFGVPSISSEEVLRATIPEDEIFPIRETKSYLLHHAVRAWQSQSHACIPLLESYFGKANSLSELIDQSNFLQSEGYKASFEEMRKQAPHCSAAVNWCLNEPWKTAANCSVIMYPANPKPAYYAIAESLRPVLFSARIPKFDWKAEEVFKAEIWMLNDSPEAADGEVSVSLKLGDKVMPLLDWKNVHTPAGENLQGAQVCCVLPNVEGVKEMTLVLSAPDGKGSEYRLLYNEKLNIVKPKVLNM